MALDVFLVINGSHTEQCKQFIGLKFHCWIKVSILLLLQPLLLRLEEWREADILAEQLRLPE